MRCLESASDTVCFSVVACLVESVGRELLRHAWEPALSRQDGFEQFSPVEGPVNWRNRRFLPDETREYLRRLSVGLVVGGVLASAIALNALGAIPSVMGLILGYYGISERNAKEE